MPLEEQTDKVIGDFVRSKGRIGKMLTSSSLVLLTLYGLGFVYLKSYLAVFGFQIELANLSIPNLLLAHRFFVSQHVFVGAGVAQSFLIARLGRAGIRKELASTAIVLAFPVLLLAVTYGASFWSEPNTPLGFDVRAPRLWVPLAAGWLCGGLCHWAVMPLARWRHLSMSFAARCVLALTVAAVTVASYRLYAIVTAEHNLHQSRLQYIEVGQEVAAGAAKDLSCGVVYADSQDLFLLCGRRRVVVSREKLDFYTVKQESI